MFISLTYIWLFRKSQAKSGAEIGFDDRETQPFLQGQLLQLLVRLIRNISLGIAQSNPSPIPSPPRTCLRVQSRLDQHPSQSTISHLQKVRITTRALVDLPQRSAELDAVFPPRMRPPGSWPASTPDEILKLFLQVEQKGLDQN
jgi:hypothetical protein